MIALACASLGPAVERQNTALQPLLQKTSITAMLLSAWPLDPLPAAREGCTWPTSAVTEPTGARVGHDLLLITIDAFRGDLGGEYLQQTLPKTIALLPEGFRFDRAYAPAPRTTYSTYAMLTGRQTHTLGFVAATTDVNDRFHRLADDDPIMLDPRSWKLLHRYPLGDKTETLPRWFRLSGHDYVTAAIVADVSLIPTAGITREFERVDARPYVRNGRRDLGGNTSTYTTESILEVIDVAKDRPFFIWAHYRDPHHPYIAYPPVDVDAPVTARYRSEFRRVDDELSKVIERLRDDGRLDSTVVVITGDHGEEFRDHGGLYHGTTLYEELIHVPLYWWIPGVRGRVIEVPVSLIDLAPTVVDDFGLDVDRRFHGRSLGPLMAGRPWIGHPVFAYNSSYTRENHQQYALILGRLKLIEDEKRQTLELYDLVDDPDERRNLSDERPDETVQMRT